MTFKKVKLIENAPLSLDTRVEVLLVYAREKPATDIDLDMEAYCLDIESNERYHAKVGSFLRKLNLSYSSGVIKYSSFDEGDEEFPSFFLAKDEDYLKRIKDSLSEIRYSDAIDLGRCFGFPETAIQAFIGEREIFTGTYFDEGPMRFFLQWVRSAEFFKEETESTAVRWHDTVKRLSKNIYNEVCQYVDGLGKSENNLVWRYIDPDGERILCFEDDL